PEPAPEPPERRRQPFDAVLRVGPKGPERRPTLGLHREPEGVRRGSEPGVDGGRARLAIERVVQLDRRETRTVELEESRSPDTGRIEARRPGRVGEAARPGPEPSRHRAIRPRAGRSP